MCGICGIVNSDSSRKVDPNILASMARSLVHRGPDDEGFFTENNVGLGHRRLSIIDLSGGHQPLFNEDGSIVVIFNGEIYNYADLTRELKVRGHCFKTRSDTEAIVHAYEEYGDDCVSRMRGMFAFAIWDRKRDRLLLARDRLGIKPLYVYRDDHFLAFASEIKALLEIPGVPGEVDRESLDLYLSLRYVPGPQTMFKNIFKLQPGHILTFESSRVQIRKYWDIEYRSNGFHSPTAYRERFEELLDESVRLRLIADVPLGVFLSGGLDSTSVLALATRWKQEPLKTFGVGYKTRSHEEEEANEFAYARIAAQRFGAEHREFRVRPEDFGDFLTDVVWHLDEPLADPTCIPLFFLSRLARQFVTVVLSGEGADETLAGYGIYRKMLMLETIHRLLKPTSFLVPKLAGLVPHEKARHYFRLAGLPLDARYRGVSRGVSPERKGRLLGTNGAENPHGLLDDIFGNHFKTVQNARPLERMLYVDTKVWLVDDLLLKADKMTMAHGLELRVPFLDHKLVELAASLPPRFKLSGSDQKHILRLAMARKIPQTNLYRSKKGFPVPWGPWLRGPLRDFTRSLLLDRDAACRTYLDPAAVRETVREHEQGTRNHAQELWTLLIFELWHRVFVDRRLSPRQTGALSRLDAPAMEVARP